MRFQQDFKDRFSHCLEDGLSDRSKHRLTRVISLGLLLSALTACDQEQAVKLQQFEQEGDTLVESALLLDVAEIEDEIQGMKLIDVVSQVALPPPQHPQHTQASIGPVSAAQLKYAGRYHVEMTCEESQIPCKQGTVQYIVNLLPDSTSHRIILHLGKVYADQLDPIRSYRKDLWDYDETLHEIVIHMVEGADLFYQIDAEHNLQMDLDKTLNYNAFNQAFFKNQYPLPNFSYRLKRYDEHADQLSMTTNTEQDANAELASAATSALFSDVIVQ